MPDHSVRIDQLPQVEILHKDIQISVVSDGQQLGKLTISKGGIGWFPKGAPLERPLTWEQFDRIIRKYFEGT